MLNSTFAIRGPFLFVGILLVLQACAPPPRMNVKLRPVAVDSSFMDDGREFVTLRQDSVAFAVAFDRCDNKYLIFNVEVTNLSSQPLRVDPAQFYYQLADTLQKIPYTSTEEVPKFYAFSPEQELAKLEEKMKREEARLKSKQIFWAVVAVAATVATAAVLVENNSRSSRDRESNYQRAATNNTVMNAWALSMDISSQAARSSVGNYYSKTDNLASQKETWEKFPIRNQTLQSGEKIYGDVVFEPHAGVGKWQFVFPVENRRFQANFTQTR